MMNIVSIIFSCPLGLIHPGMFILYYRTHKKVISTHTCGNHFKAL